MNDRFKFRAYFNNIKYTLDDEDENGDDIKIKKEASFHLYNVTIYADGDGIGIQRDDFEKQLEEQGFSEDDIEALLDFHDSISEDEYGWVWIGVPCTKEQCTGLKDKNGKLIYEGDIFTYTQHKGYNLDAFTGVVVWSDVSACFGYKRIINGSICNSFNPLIRHDEIDIDFSPYIEIIDNIHENPELVGVQNETGRN